MRTALHGTNVVYCAVSEEQLLIVAKNLANAMSLLNISILPRDFLSLGRFLFVIVCFIISKFNRKLFVNTCRFLSRFFKYGGR